MIRDHKFYEMQSALAATGHLTESEVTELEQHVSQCSTCRICMVDMAAVSRELFLTQSPSTNPGSPRGMQQRFVLRAVAAGIPLEAKATTRHAGLRFALFAAIGVTLALLLSFNWKVASTPHVELAGQHPPSQVTKTPEPAFPASRAITVGRTTKASLRRSRRRELTKGSPAFHLGDEANTDLSLNRPMSTDGETPTRFSDDSEFWSQRLNRSYLTASRHTAGRSSVTSAYTLDFHVRDSEAKRDERSFHLDLTVASLSHSDSSLSAGIGARLSSFKFTKPVFRIDPNRNW